MLVKLTQSFLYTPNESKTMIRNSVVNLADAIAADWIQAGLAERLTEPPPNVPRFETATKPSHEKAVTRKSKRS